MGASKIHFMLQKFVMGLARGKKQNYLNCLEGKEHDLFKNHKWSRLPELCPLYQMVFCTQTFRYGHPRAGGPGVIDIVAMTPDIRRKIHCSPP